MLSRFWPPALARAWLMVYSQAYRSHRVAARRELAPERPRLEPVSASQPTAAPESGSGLQLKGAGPGD